MPIRIITGKRGWAQLSASFKKNYRHYLQEGLGLGIFMISACFFGALLEANNSIVHDFLKDAFQRSVIMGILMGVTALFIFYSPLTSPSGSQVNPAVTLTFLRLGKMCHWDAVFYILSQFTGGLLSVYVMRLLLKHSLIDPPVNSVATIPGKAGMWSALFIEFIIAFLTMSMVLFTSRYDKWKKYTRLFAGILVCCWVIIAGPISGFGMNPARSFASSLPSGIWTASWIYFIIPVAGMLAAAEVFLVIQKHRITNHSAGNVSSDKQFV